MKQKTSLGRSLAAWLLICMMTLSMIPVSTLAAEQGTVTSPEITAEEIKLDSTPIFNSESSPTEPEPSPAEPEPSPAEPETMPDESGERSEKLAETDLLEIQPDTVSQETYAAQNSLNIYEIRVGPKIDKPLLDPIEVNEVCDHVYLAEYEAPVQASKDILCMSAWYLVGSLAPDRSIKQVWAPGIGPFTGEIFNYTANPGEYQGPCFSLFMKGWVNNGRSYFDSLDTNRPLSLAAGCFYIELDNGEVYTLVVLTNQLKNSENEKNLPSFVNLFNDSKSEWLDDEYQITSMGAGRSTHLIETTLHSSSADAYRIQVVNGGNYLYDSNGGAVIKLLTGLNWRDLKTNQVWVNGRELPAFASGDEDAAAGVFSAPFYLEPGVNVVEVRAGMSSAACVYDLNLYGNKWFVPSFVPPAGVVYLINYDGPAASGSAVDNGTDTSLAYAKAVIHGAADSNLTAAPLNWNEDKQQYELVLPESFRKASNDKTSFDRGVLLTAKPKTSGAVAKVVPASGDDGLVVGEPMGCVTALAMNNLKNTDSRFTIQVTAADGATTKDYPVQVLYASSEASLTGLTLSGASLSPAFQQDTLDYYVTYGSAEAGATMTLTHSGKGSITVDGQPYSGPVTITAARDYHKVTVIAEDGYTKVDYYLVTKLSDGRIPYCTVSEDTKEIAKEMLKYWYKDMAGKKQFTSYWSIFGAKAAKSDAAGHEVDFNNKNVYDVSRHKMKQATDWGACIMELVMLGQNPYDFPRRDEDGNITEHFNYVEALEEQGGGPFANNVWYMMAANAAGVDPVYTEAAKENALSPTYDLDTRAWWIAALSVSLEPREMVRYVESLHDAQSMDGEYTSLFYNKVFPLGWDNLYTNGCVFSAVASAGADIEKQFVVNGTSPLHKLKEHNMNPDGSYTAQGQNTGIPKDMIIGLGDTIQGSNVWARYALTEEKYDALKTKADELDVSYSGTWPEYGEEGYGKDYYDLYEKVADAAEATGDTTMRPKVIWGMPYQLFEDAVAVLPPAENITNSHVDDVEKAIAQYEALDDANKQAVAKDTLTKYHAVVAAALDAQDSTKTVSGLYKRILNLRDPLLISEKDRPEVESIRKAYDAMDDALKTLMSWAGPSVLEKLEKIEAVLGKHDPDVKPETMTITYRLLGDYVHDENGPVHTLKSNNLETWHSGNYTFNANSISAEEAFRVIMDDAGIDWKGDSANSFGTLYVSAIKSPSTGDWLEEFTNTAKSGWMYTVNGSHPNVGMSNYTLEDGDVFIVHYTDDYTKEQGSEEWSKKDPILDPTNPGVDVDTTVGKDGIASGSMSGDAVQAFLAAIENATDSKGTVATISVSVPKDAKGVELTIPRAVISALGSTSYTSFEIASNAGSITMDPKTLATVVKAAGSGEVVFRLAPTKPTLSEETKKLVGERPVYEVTIKANGKLVTDLGGKAELVLPYTPAKGEDADKLTVYHLPEQGDPAEMEGAKYNKSRKGVVFDTTHLSAFAVGLKASAAQRDYFFTDVPEGHWAAEYVYYLAEKGILTGKTETTFGPGDQISRSEFVTILARMSGDKLPSADLRFTDVKATDWHAQYVAWAVKAGITKGTSETTFSPLDLITREDMAVMIARYAEYKGFNLPHDLAPAKFADADEIASYASESMTAMQRAGIIGGKEGNLAAPKDKATRAEAAKMLAVLMQLMEV